MRVTVAIPSSTAAATVGSDAIVAAAVSSVKTYFRGVRITLWPRSLLGPVWTSLDQLDAPCVLSIRLSLPTEERKSVR